MVTQAWGPVTATMQCALCHVEINFDDKAIVVIQYPNPDSDMFCAQCWYDILACADAWLCSEGEPDEAGCKSRIDEARARFKARNGRLGHKAPRAQK